MASHLAVLAGVTLLCFFSISHTLPSLTEEEENNGDPPESFGETDHQLVIDLLRKDRVDGYYVNPHIGCGIVFNSTRDSLMVSALNGSRLLSAEERVGPVRLVTLGDREFLQHRGEDNSNVEGESGGTVQDYAIPKHRGSFAGTRDGVRLTNLLETLKKLDRNSHTKVLQKSMEQILTEPEMGLLQEAAVAMGHQGITGMEYPGSLPLYLTAMRLDSRRLAAEDFHQFVSNPDRYKSLYASGRVKRSAMACLKKCPPCKRERCLGMCGRACSCWEWACGDCCYHKGCYYHDLCCRSRPYSLACWLPLDFDCNEKYICKDPF